MTKIEETHFTVLYGLLGVRTNQPSAHCAMFLEGVLRARHSLKPVDSLKLY